MNAEWRQVPDQDGKYEVSDTGQIIRVAYERRYLDGRVGWIEERVLKPTIDKDGYLKVRLKKSGGVERFFFVHALVAAAFIGPRPKGHVVRHLNDDRRNNAPSNLAYGTHQDNMDDALINGRRPCGERVSKAALKNEDIQKIRSDSRSGPHLAKEFGVSVRTISAIRRRHTWSHI